MTVAPHTTSLTQLPSAFNEEALTLMQWLDALHTLMPPTQLTYWGAGAGHQALLNWAAIKAVGEVSLVEGHSHAFTSLSERWQKSHPHWQFHNEVMETGLDEEGIFYTASHQTESGLLSPETLTSLWPHIEPTHQQACEPVRVADWAKQHWTLPGQWVVIDYFCDAGLLAAHAAAFRQVEVLKVRVSTLETVPEPITGQAWEPALKQAGYRVLKRATERHPHIEQWLCIKQQDSDVAAANESLANVQAELAEVKGKLEKTHTWFMNRKQQAMEFEQQVAVLESTLKATQEELAQARQQSAQLKLLKESLEQLSQQVSQGFTIQSEQRQQATNALGKHITQLLQSSQSQPPKEEKDNL
ncbi:hypothetical protein GCM10007158_09170 [Vreelandella hamiltonii]|uniref:Uncharacterized protein n=2 Tax=Halomonadaceae TaxID=28256 RepID=A0ABQ2WFY2_9GAMM|nr:hypothetical protein GCM10007158_09170 [Halomonas johnsoniae]